jgi:choline dehydrogenase
LKVSDQRFTNEIIDAVIEAAAQAGIPRNNDFNGATQEGVCLLEFSDRPMLDGHGLAAYYY